MLCLVGVGAKDVIERSLNFRDKMTELGDQVVRSLEARIIEVVAIKRQQEENTRKTMTSAELADYYTAGRLVIEFMRLASSAFALT